MADNKKLQLNFPKSFLWGASISTHQAEGGNHNQWSIWELETARTKVAQAEYNYGHLPRWKKIKPLVTNPDNYVSGDACDHYNLYQEDFSLAKKLNFTALRSGVEWSRIEPEEGVFNEEALQHYKQYFSSLKKQGMTPIITLWHWTFPDWFAAKGGFEKRGNIKYFTRYVTKITEQLGEYFQYVITINEPTVYSAMSYHERRWPPEQGSTIMMVRVLLNLARAHRKSYRIIKKINPKARIGIAHHCTYYYAGDDAFISKITARISNYAMNFFFINRIHGKQDYMGLNFYFANRVIGTRVDNPNNLVNDLGWDMQPDKVGLMAALLYKKYNLPILITENGVADSEDAYRKWWIIESVKSINTAIQNGVSFLGYIHWSLLDNFEWAEGFWPRFGLIEIDYKTKKRTIRPSAQWYGRMIKAIKRQL